MLSKGERNILSVGYGSNKSKVKAIIIPAHLYIILYFFIKLDVIVATGCYNLSTISDEKSKVWEIQNNVLINKTLSY